MLTLNLLGAGRLGKSIAQLAQQSGRYALAGIYSRSLVSSTAACEWIGAGQVAAQLSALPPADLWLLAVPDGAIASVAAELAQAGVVNAGAVVFHASGALAADQLAPLAAQGAHCASWHPAFSFADPARAVATFAGSFCTLEGAPAALSALDMFTQALGGQSIYLPAADGAQRKQAYHAALSMASNFQVTLAALAQQVAAQAGLDQPVAQALIASLMQQTLHNIAALGPAAALTGPIVRGDHRTVAAHLAVLPQPLHPVYRELGLQTVALAGERLSAAQHAALRQLLQVAS
ncbi:Rossmann-like and DUF2520 domain-containing protein [Chitinibacter tainanensis]|uniref:Rossmann-like and DUF2520 domain-containing protein n=1 Tax=Chitinibacter tainanensis TaxID=230667 RepID=UPI002356E8D2|nr:Rossmann-like and DUF2520 domain-containing protein [Chitinibacter tainanensis]